MAIRDQDYSSGMAGDQTGTPPPPQNPAPTEHVCPVCGRCPRCGSVPPQPWPIPVVHPYYVPPAPAFPYPYPPQGPIWLCRSGIVGAP